MNGQAVQKVNIIKREKVLAGQSVWYSDCVNIGNDSDNAWKNINKINWVELNREDFVKEISRAFPILWQVHPLREGNTRTTVMMTFFVEHYGYYFDQNLMAESTGYVRDSFVLASLGEYSEYEHLEKILNDAICTEPVDYDEIATDYTDKKGKYEKYRSDDYTPTKHEYIK